MILLATGAFVACGGAKSRAGFEPAADAGPAEDAGNGGPSTGLGSSDAGPTLDSNGCSEEAKLVYVLSLEGDLYSFAPAKKAFTKVGPLDCRSGEKKFTPISMAVDRKAVAWVNMRYSDPVTRRSEDTLFTVDTKTALCTESEIHDSVGGMGFSTDDGTKDKETLFVSGQGSPGLVGLSKVDFDLKKVVPIADLSQQIGIELTGTGDGRLYGFLVGEVLQLARVDKVTAQFSDYVDLPDVVYPKVPMYAFSFWGGDFYFYTAPDSGPATTTTVARYRPSDKSVVTDYMTSIGFHIVGAGVSTCAPTAPPR